MPEGDGTVKAELIEILIEDWAVVDGLEDYPRLYNRQLMQATLADGSEATGWVYIMNTLPPMAKIIESGSWKEYVMDKTVLIEQTSKRLKRWELIVTAMLFLTLFCRFRVALCGNPSSGSSMVAFRGVPAGFYRSEIGGLVVAWVKFWNTSC